MSEIWMVLGFSLAAYSIVANDSIQTLGTFLSSNERRPWWLIWLFISGVLVVTVTWGWVDNGGDPAFGRLGAEGKEIAFPPLGMTWLFVIPPLVLVIFTQSGIPVSTSLLVLTAFKGLVAQQMAEDTKGALELFLKMMEKSLVGYGIAFVLGFVVFFSVLHFIEKRVKKDDGMKIHPAWLIFQWCSTGFLWSMWLVQDLANIFCYLPRELELWGLALALGGMVLLQGYLIKNKGGKIQGIVSSKVNTIDVRSATFIDFFYGLVLLFFKMNFLKVFPEKLPMSTTWIFLGLLAGRELGLVLRLKHQSKKAVSGIIFSDAGKAFFGSIVSVVLALTLPLIATRLMPVKVKKQEDREIMAVFRFGASQRSN